MSDRLPDRPGQSGPALRVVHGILSVVLATLYVLTASLGILTTPPTALLVLSPVLALTVVALYLLACQGRPPDRPAPRHVVTAGLAGASVLPFASGARLMGAFGAAVSLSVLAIAVVLVGMRLVADSAAVGRRLPGAVVRSPAASSEEAVLRALLRRAPLEMLFRRWHATGRTLRSTPRDEQYTTAVYLRALLLDELLVRDPAGAQRWIDQGITRSPELYIRSDQDLSR